MAISDRENYLRNALMRGPEWIPCHVVISGASWKQFGKDLEEVVIRHRRLFPHFEKAQWNYKNCNFGLAHRANELYTDAWGCTWKTAIDGLEGQVIKSPLTDWNKLKTYKAPDPMIQDDRGPIDWEGIRRKVEEAKKKGDLITMHLPHGSFFMRLYYLRGFENLMIDMATESLQLPKLIDIVVRHNMKIINKWLSMGDIDVIWFQDDLGTQVSSMMGSKAFHKWLTPSYKEMMQLCHKADSLVHLHSDGYIMDLMDEFLECGVNIINPQDLCNGIDNLARQVKGRMCISLDIDRQKIVPYGTRKEIRELIEEEVRKLGSSQGGLEFICGIYPPTPPENVDALCDALEEFQTYWWR